MIEDYKFAQEELQNNKGLSQKLVSMKQEKSQLEIDVSIGIIAVHLCAAGELSHRNRSTKRKGNASRKTHFCFGKTNQYADLLQFVTRSEQLDDTLNQKTQQHQIEIGNLEADTKKIQFSATEKENLQSQIKQLQTNKRDLEEKMQYLEKKNQYLAQQLKERDAKILEEQQLNELRLERLQAELLQYRE